MLFRIWGSNRLVRKCSDKSRPQKREIAENLRELHVMKDGVNYQRLGLTCVNPQGP